MVIPLNPRPSAQHLRDPESVGQCRKDRFEPIDSKLLTTLTERRSQFLRLLQQRLGNRDEAEDVLQDFHLKVLLKGGQIKNGDSTVAWLHTVLRSVLVDHVRKEAKRREAHQLIASEWLATSAQDEIAAADEELFDRAACTCFYRLLPILKAEYADVLARIDLAQQERDEAARDLGITPGNMRVRLHRARTAPREELKVSCRKCRERDCFGRQRPPGRRPAKPAQASR